MHQSPKGAQERGTKNARRHAGRWRRCFEMQAPGASKTEIYPDHMLCMHESEAFRRMYAQYGYASNSPDARPPPAIHFPREPPEPFGRPVPMPGRPAARIDPRSRDHVARLGDAVDGFRRVFHQQASGLLLTGTPPVPPGHPLYNSQLAITALEAERDSLLKENADLKKRLEGSKGEDVPQPP